MRSSTASSHNKYAELHKLVRPHLDSFNYFLTEGIQQAVTDLDPIEIMSADGHSLLTCWIDEVQVGFPCKQTLEERLYPRECREAGISYLAPVYLKVSRQVSSVQDDKLIGSSPVRTISKNAGRMPMMVRSVKCTLGALGQGAGGSHTMIRRGEDASEMGGYFVVNGVEKVVRMLCVQRRNYPMALAREHHVKSGKRFSPYAIVTRCVRRDQTSVTVSVHYLLNGDCTVRFALRRVSYFIPALILLRALVDTTDRAIYEKILQGDTENTFVSDRIEAMLREWATHTPPCDTRAQCLAYIGSRFRSGLDLPERWTDIQAGETLLRKYLFVHLDSMEDKFNFLIFVIRKLYAFAHGEIVGDNPDSPMNQELLLPGHLFNMLLKEQLQLWLQGLKAVLLRDMRKSSSTQTSSAQSTQNEQDPKMWLDDVYFRACLNKVGEPASKLLYFVGTGNLPVSHHTGLELRQTSGFSIVAEKINYLRFLSHFRCVHRGQFFAQMRTTTVRKLLPESWGFLCPVHTPDGAPCGLLTHLTCSCLVTTGARTPQSFSGLSNEQEQRERNESVSVARNSSNWENVEYEPFTALHLTRWLCGNLGLIPTTATRYPKDSLALLLDGVVLGYVPYSRVARLTDVLRYFKVSSTPSSTATPSSSSSSLSPIISTIALGHIPFIPPELEICVVPPAATSRQYPAIYLFSGPARMMRPVLNLQFNHVEWIGTFEQPYLQIAVEPTQSDATYTHAELDPTNILSVTANLTPFSDFNQSPRNMYQCQMAKQSMGIPCHNWPHRTDNKLYRLQTPQSPVTRTSAYVKYNMDDYPLGTNAVVAVISYTGYDMEDAMIINKSAFERGFKHASVYKCRLVDLSEGSTGGCTKYFHNLVGPENEHRRFVESLDEDGLPFPGQPLQKGDPLYCVWDEVTQTHKVTYYQGQEPCIVDQITVVGLGATAHLPNDDLQRLCKVQFKFLYSRNPTRGDKFSSRHGQKGVMSQLWPQVDMPFTESGITPDIIINPNAFPSRMTIGMLIESMAGKAGCLHGIYQEAEPWRFDAQHTAVDYFGQQLVRAGFNYYGNEVMYSGITGTEFPADIYIGVVYYQRLRHMVSDKYQVRATGPVNRLTRQPIKGRKKGGGIRFGEMERDSLLGHGASLTLHDRLFLSSDFVLADICRQCGSLLTATLLLPPKQIVASNQSPQSSSANVGEDPHTSALTLSTAVPFSSPPRRQLYCRYCTPNIASITPRTKSTIVQIAVPFVFRYLVAELAAMNVRISVDVK
jgi:DNA-directed RNA polymerase I subunit RPA2